MRLAIFSAFPQEIRRVVKEIKAVRSPEGPFPLFFGKCSTSDITIALTGMGGRNAETAFGHVLKEYTPDLALSLGFGGALYDGAAGILSIRARSDSGARTSEAKT